jgi:hypothetical protein
VIKGIVPFGKSQQCGRYAGPTGVTTMDDYKANVTYCMNNP